MTRETSCSGQTLAGSASEDPGAERAADAGQPGPRQAQVACRVGWHPAAEVAADEKAGGRVVEPAAHRKDVGQPGAGLDFQHAGRRDGTGDGQQPGAGLGLRSGLR